MAGVLSSEILDSKPDVNGTTFLDAANQAGYGGKSHKVNLFYQIYVLTRVSEGRRKRDLCSRLAI